MSNIQDGPSVTTPLTDELSSPEFSIASDLPESTPSLTTHSPACTASPLLATALLPHSSTPIQLPSSAQLQLTRQPSSIQPVPSHSLSSPQLPLAPLPPFKCRSMTPRYHLSASSLLPRPRPTPPSPHQHSKPSSPRHCQPLNSLNHQPAQRKQPWLTNCSSSTPTHIHKQ